MHFQSFESALNTTETNVMRLRLRMIFIFISILIFFLNSECIFPEK